MKRLWALFPVLFFTVTMPGSIAGAQSKSSVAEQYLFSAANAERLQRGLPPLHWDAALYRAAQGHAQEMAARASISHQYPGEAELADRGRRAGARFSEIAENVAEAPTAVRIHDAWMNSPGHRANLLDPQVDSVGISVLRRDGQLLAGWSLRFLSQSRKQRWVRCCCPRRHWSCCQRRTMCAAPARWRQDMPVPGVRGL